MVSISLGLADWAANLDFASIPADIADATKLRILVTHAFIDAALHLRRLEVFRSDEIVSVACPVAEYMVALVCEPAEERRNPRTVGSARISLPHIIAEALVFGEIGPRSFSEERRSDARVRALAECTEYQIDPDAPGRERYKGWVQIRLRDGRVLERVEEHNLGSPQKPLGEAALREKLRVNVEGAIGAGEAERIADSVLSLDRQDDTLHRNSNSSEPPRRRRRYSLSPAN